MTLTEEQREAIRAVSDLPRAIGCTRCHNYIQKNYSNQFAVLRSMIDNKDYVPNAAKLIELLAAGEHEQWADWAQSILDSEPGLSEGRKAAWPGMIATPYENLSEELKDKDRREVHLRSQAALDYIQQQSAEIERLRASLIDLHAEYINTLEKNPDCSAWDLDEQSDADQRRLRKNAAHAISITEPPIYLQAEQLAARIKELEDALVEAKAAMKFCLDEGDEDENYGPMHDLPEWRELPEKDKDIFRDWCRKQLVAEGELGPDAKPRVWQITEERKAAIWHAVAVLKENDPDDEHLWDEEIAVLRAMLREAE